MKDKYLTLNITVIPNSSKEGIFIQDDKIKVKVHAPPVEGKANEAIERLFSKTLKIPISHIKIIKGLNSKHKLLQIENLTKEEFEKRIFKNL